MMYIKGHDWVKYKIGETRLLVSMVFLGLFLNMWVALILVEHDHQSVLSKMCNHYSERTIETLEQYQVFLSIFQISF